MKLDYDESLCDYRMVKLPDQFWFALKEIRDLWIRVEWFQDLLYHPVLGDKMVRGAFDFFDSYLRAMLDEIDAETN